MTRIYYSEKLFLLSYFLFLIAMGSLLLFLPVSWQGGGKPGYIDALFTAASAVCVTGLDNRRYLIIFADRPGHYSPAYSGRGTGYYKFYHYIPGETRKKNIPAVEWEPLRIIKRIILMTFIIEGIGVLPLFFIFSAELKDGALFCSIFHSVSAFGTVGLSLGITPMLSVPGKIVIILTMFSGRVGLMLLAIPAVKGYPAHMLDYPKGEVLIG